jgi:hypothetical protein
MTFSEGTKLNINQGLIFILLIAILLVIRVKLKPLVNTFLI